MTRYDRKRAITIIRSKLKRSELKSYEKQKSLIYSLFKGYGVEYEEFDGFAESEIKTLFC